MLILIIKLVVMLFIIILIQQKMTSADYVFYVTYCIVNFCFIYSFISTRHSFFLGGLTQCNMLLTYIDVYLDYGSWRVRGHCWERLQPVNQAETIKGDLQWTTYHFKTIDACCVEKKVDSLPAESTNKWCRPWIPLCLWLSRRRGKLVRVCAWMHVKGGVADCSRM